MHTIIFEADTPAGKLFDVVLLIAIALSVIVVMLASVQEIGEKYSFELIGLEWGITILFTLEYVARIISVGKPLKYIFSFWGIIDLLAILPTYLGLFLSGTGALVVIRTIRLLRVFRVMQMYQFMGEAKKLSTALRNSGNKIIVFLGAVLIIVVIMGTLMFLVEGAENGFTSIPRSIYWAIVTLTTVGYGDVVPRTVPGQALASIIMILGYAIIAVPTGIVSAEFASHQKDDHSNRACPECSREGHSRNAVYCKFCSARL